MTKKEKIFNFLPLLSLPISLVIMKLKDRHSLSIAGPGLEEFIAYLFTIFIYFILIRKIFLNKCWSKQKKYTLFLLTTFLSYFLFYFIFYTFMIGLGIFAMIVFSITGPPIKIGW